jgi:hypothetical protein
MDMDQRPETYWPEGRPAPSGAPTESERAEAKELGKQHPAFMGGAYLPDGLDGEVEIARLDSQSVTGDVMSLRAHRAGDRIAYRLVDEYEVDWHLPIPESDAPLTLAEVLEQLDGAQMDGEPEVTGVTIAWRQRNLMEPSDAPDLIDFLRVTSRLYPDLERIDRERAERWAAEVGP